MIPVYVFLGIIGLFVLFNLWKGYFYQKMFGRLIFLITEVLILAMLIIYTTNPTLMTQQSIDFYIIVIVLGIDFFYCGIYESVKGYQERRKT